MKSTTNGLILVSRDDVRKRGAVSSIGWRALFLACFAIGTSHAATVRVTFDGHIIDGATFATGIANGTPLTGTLEYSTDVADVNSSTTIGDYRFLYSDMTLSIGTQNVPIFGLSGIFQSNRLFIEKRPAFDILASTTGFVTTHQFNGWTPFRLDITLSDTERNALASDSLPTSIFLSDWDGMAVVDCFLCSNEGWVAFQRNNGSSQVSARVKYDHIVTELLPEDDAPPSASGVVGVPNLLTINSAAELIATVDDSSTGDSAILSAEFSVDGGSYTAMQADDGAFDSSTEIVAGTLLGFTEPGVYDLCVRGTDDLGNTSDPTADPDNACTLIVAYDPDGGFVTGGGWFYSAAGACQYSADCLDAGKANFGFVSRYKMGATVPTGSTEFNFATGGFNFHSDVYQWLVVNMGGTNAQYKGSGTVNNNFSPAGDVYQFMLWARDGGGSGADEFRIKIWYADAGNNVVVYDNGFGQEIAGGNIVIRTK